MSYHLTTNCDFHCNHNYDRVSAHHIGHHRDHRSDQYDNEHNDQQNFHHSTRGPERLRGR